MHFFGQYFVYGRVYTTANPVTCTGGTSPKNHAKNKKKNFFYKEPARLGDEKIRTSWIIVRSMQYKPCALYCIEGHHFIRR